MNPSTPSLSPLTGGKVLSRDLSLLQGLSVADRRNYIVLSAASDAQGRFYRQSLDIGVDLKGIGRLVKQDLVASYKHGKEDVYEIPGGRSHERYGYSPISTAPPTEALAPSASDNRLFLHRDHRLLYRGLGTLETVVLHALVNLSDYHGRGRLDCSKLLEIIGKCKLNRSSLGLKHLGDSCVELFLKGRLMIYEVKDANYYAALDAKQWAMDFIPSSQIPPPVGEDWNYSFDSPEGLAWHQQRKETRTERTAKRKAKAAASPGKPGAGAAKRALAGEATEKDLDDLFSKSPHKRFKDDRSSAPVFAAHVLTGEIKCPLSERCDALRTLVKHDRPVELAWFARVTGKQAADALRETTESLRADMGAEPRSTKPARRRKATPDQELPHMFRPSKPFHTGINAFDHHYGRHARGGDAWMFFGTSAAGTTLLASQTAGHTAQQGKLVAYITTTSRSSEILLHVYCSVSGNSWEDMRRFAALGNQEFNNWRATVGTNLEIYEYSSAQGSSFEEKYKRLMEAFHTQYGRFPDLTVLDDLDKVVQGDFTDHVEKLKAYNAAAAIVASTAAELDHVVVVIARASTSSRGQAEFKKCDTAESRSLHEYMSGMAGFSSLPGSGHPTYKYLVVCKCPRGQEPLRIMVEQNCKKSMFTGQFDGE